MGFYEGKEHAPCPLTDELVKAGYQQERDGYIQLAYEKNIPVNYKESKPSQWWHLIEVYCKGTELEKQFPKSVKCGELYFWMAEMSGCFEDPELRDLKSRAIKKAKKINRRNTDLSPIIPSCERNELIRDFCFDRIEKAVE